MAATTWLQPLVEHEVRMCSVAGCVRKHYGKGFCNAHYQQIVRLGWPEPKPVRDYGPGRPRSQPRLCDFPGCGQPHEARGLCVGHRKQVISGYPLTDLRPKRDPLCLVGGCVQPHRRNGLCHRHSTIARKYNVAPVVLVSIFARSPVCEACGTAFWGGRWKSPCIDHDHRTGLVRGVLCARCNLVLGHADENIERLKGVIAYLEK